MQPIGCYRQSYVWEAHSSNIQAFLHALLSHRSHAGILLTSVAKSLALICQSAETDISFTDSLGCTWPMTSLMRRCLPNGTSEGNDYLSCMLEMTFEATHFGLVRMRHTGQHKRQAVRLQAMRYTHASIERSRVAPPAQLRRRVAQHDFITCPVLVL